MEKKNEWDENKTYRPGDTVLFEGKECVITEEGSPGNRVELPKKLIVTENFEIVEQIGNGTVGATRILLTPSEGYLGDDRFVQLEEVIKALVYRYSNYTELEELLKRAKCPHKLCRNGTIVPITGMPYACEWCKAKDQAFERTEIK